MRRSNLEPKTSRGLVLPLFLMAALVACIHARHVNEGTTDKSGEKASKEDKKDAKKAGVASKDDKDSKKDDKDSKKDAKADGKDAQASAAPATGTASHDEPPTDGTDGKGGSGMFRPSARHPTGTRSHAEPPSDNVQGQNKTGIVLAVDPAGLRKPDGDAKIAKALQKRGFLKADDTAHVDPETLAAAIRKFQKSKDTEETGFADEQTLRQLGLSPKDINRTP